MLTVRVRLIEGVTWSLSHNQRVHVHHGTAEVLARCALLEESDLQAGDSGWIQLRLEEPLAARVRDRIVIRAYSPVTTIGGGAIAEATPPKRNRIDERIRTALDTILDGSAPDAIAAHLELAGWSGGAVSALPIHVGIPPSAVESSLTQLEQLPILRTTQRMFAPGIRLEAERRVLAAVEEGHTADPLRAAVSLAAVRAALPRWAPPDMGDAIVSVLVAEGRLESADGGVRHPDHRPALSPQQEVASARLEAVLSQAGLASPSVDELPEDLRERDDLWSLLRRLEGLGRVRQVADGLYVDSAELDAATARIGELLGGQRNLGPAAFRDALPVTRKRLIPLLNYFDGQGTTIRHEKGRDVPERE